MKWLVLLFILLVVGCATNSDLNTLMLLNARLSTIENKLDKIENTKQQFYVITNTVTRTKTNTVTRVITNNVIYTQSAVPQEYTQTVNVLNSNGSTSLIAFKLRNGKWYGPKGEMYEEMPKKRDVERIYKF